MNARHRHSFTTRLRPSIGASRPGEWGGVFANGAFVVARVRQAGSAVASDPDKSPAARAVEKELQLAGPLMSQALLERIDGLLRRNEGAPIPVDAARPKVLLVEDDAALRERRYRFLNPDYDVVAALAEGETAPGKAAELQPDLILLDIGLPGMNGFAVARILRRDMPRVSLVFVTQHADLAYVEEGFASGGAGYVLKRHLLSELPAALRQVRSGTRYLSPDLSGPNVRTGRLF